MKMRKMAMSLCLATCLGSFLGISSEELERKELPLEEVVLYSSGVGMFIHGGSVNGDLQVTLDLDNVQLNDALKSLLIFTEEGIAVKSINYPSKVSLRNQLKQAKVDVERTNNLIALLDKLRGANFDIKMKGNLTFSGRYIGSVVLKGGEKEGEEVYLDFIASENDYQHETGGLFRVKLSHVETILPSDESLRKELEKSFKIIASASDSNMKTMKVSVSSPDRDRLVRLAYVIASPTWKASYRLILPKEKEGNSTLQAWALIENPTATDWKDVKVSLVSGKVSSFVQDLYSSLWIRRPEVENDVSVLTPVKGQAFVASNSLKRKAANQAVSMAAPKPESVYADEECEEADFATDGFFGGSKSDAAGGRVTGTEAGGAVARNFSSMSRYKLKQPVSLASNESAMVELTTLQTTAKCVSIYNQRVHATNPLNAVILHNNSSMLLPTGPITVVAEDGTYLGDASMSSLVADQKQLLSYGLDQEVYVMHHMKDLATTDTIRDVAVRGTQLIIKRCIPEELIYTISNQSKKSRTLVIEHDKRHNYELAEGMQAPSEENQEKYRFEIELEAEMQKDFSVKENRLSEQYLPFYFERLENLERQLAGIKFPKAEHKEYFDQLFAKYKDYTQLVQQERDLNVKRNHLQESLDRAHNSYGTLNKGKEGDNNVYLKKLSERIADLDKQLFDIFIQVETIIKNKQDKQNEIKEFMKKASSVLK